VKAIDAFGLTSVHTVGLDVDRRRSSSARSCGQNSSAAHRGCRRHVYPLDVDGALKWMIEAEPCRR